MGNGMLLLPTRTVRKGTFLLGLVTREAELHLGLEKPQRLQLLFWAFPLGSGHSRSMPLFLGMARATGTENQSEHSSTFPVSS